MTTLTIFTNPPTEIVYDEKKVRSQLLKEQEIYCASRNAYLVYMQVKLSMRNSKATIVKAF